MVPNLLKMAILREGRRHCTNSSMSCSVSSASFVVMLYQRFSLKRSLNTAQESRDPFHVCTGSEEVVHVVCDSAHVVEVCGVVHMVCVCVRYVV